MTTKNITKEGKKGLLARVRQKGQITLPVQVRKHLGIEEGDYIEVHTSGVNITIKPKEVVDRYPEIDASIKKGLQDVQRNNMYGPFRNVQEMKRYFKRHPIDKDAT